MGRCRLKQGLISNRIFLLNLPFGDSKGLQVFKGNQLIIPIKNSFLYVEPVYLQSEQGKIPELKRVIVAYNDQIEMKNTLEESLQAIFNSSGSQDTLSMPQIKGMEKD